MVLALYDLRSKQEYIYRTNRIREISGASFLLANIFDEFIEKAVDAGISVRGITEAPFSLSAFENSGSDAEVIYNGGGNLMMLYKDNDAYVRANKVFSRLLFDRTYTVSAVVSKTEFTGNFKKDRDAVYQANALKKNTGAVSCPCSVLPFTQIDARTFMPVTFKDNYHNESICREAELKREKYEGSKENQDPVLSTILLDEMTLEKGRESLLAIIYIDGNNMGAKLKEEIDKHTDYDSGVKALREFSINANEAFVERPIAAIERNLEQLHKKQKEKMIAKYGEKKYKDSENYVKYRRVIAGGDEITLICNARIVPEILDVYFKTLDREHSGNYACAGVAIFHSHAPFADVYEIAEQCCESGKKCSRDYGSNANFIDFHYCRAGITNDMEIVREKQEKGLTARPYRVDGGHNGYSYPEFIGFAKKIKAIGRSNIKELAAAIIRGDSYYRFEVERINSRRFKIKLKDEEERTDEAVPKKERLIHIDPKDEKSKKMIFDIAQVYDLWFAEEGEEEKQCADISASH